MKWKTETEISVCEVYIYQSLLKRSMPNLGIGYMTRRGARCTELACFTLLMIYITDRQWNLDPKRLDNLFYKEIV